ncbi:MAG: ABC transporter ATP-binding protein [Spirochaetaceae bacterium]
MSERLIAEARDVEVAYDEVTVLNGVDCRIRAGEITCIVGGSGSGKTTLLKALFGLVPVSRGSVRLFGEELQGMEEAAYERALRRIGVLFQNGALLNSLSVFENIAIPLEQHTGLSEPIIRRMVEVKLGLVNLSGSEDLYPAELSGGMKKRAGLARAIALDPAVVFLDEPSAGLDPQNVAALDQLMMSLRDRLSVTLVVVSHELASIRRIADRIVFVHEGRVGFEGTLVQARESGVPELRAFLEPDSG